MVVAMLPGPSSRNGCQTLVHSPLQPGFGRQVWGKVLRVNAQRYDAFSHGGPRSRGGSMLRGSFPSEQAAVADIEGWGQQVMTSEALQAEFAAETAGGVQLVFLRRAASYIACTVLDGIFPWQGNWGEDGICNDCRQPVTTEERQMQERLRLVRLKPAPSMLARLAPAFFSVRV